MNREAPIGMPWVSVLGFLRVVTHPAVLTEPLPALEALARIETWLERDHVRVLDPGPRHLMILRNLLEATAVAGGLTTDTHLAALAIEHQCELHSNDFDFARFPGLRWKDPIT